MVDPRRAPSPRPAPNAWARVRLLKGESTGGLWDVTSEINEARIAVGTDATCGWVVSAPGVVGMHFELYWDGNSLWVGNPRGARDLSLDGEPLGDWAAVTGKARLEFGRAAMLIETSAVAQTSVHSDSLPPPGAGDDRTMVRPPPSEMRARLTQPSQREYATGSTGLHRLPEGAPPPEDVANENTRIGPELSPQAQRMLAPARQAMPATTNAGDPAATRVVSFDDMEAQRPKAGPRVGMGAGTAQITDGRPTRGIGGDSVPAIATEATRLGASPVAPGYGEPPPTYIAPAAQVAAAPPPSAVAPYAAPAAPAAAAPAAPTPTALVGGFAAPPPPPPALTTGQQAANLTEKIKIALKPQAGGKPTSRTWLLLALVVAVVVVFFVLDDDPPPAAAPEDGGGAVAQPTNGLPAQPVIGPNGLPVQQPMVGPNGLPIQPSYVGPNGLPVQPMIGPNGLPIQAIGPNGLPVPPYPAPVAPTNFAPPYGAQVGVPIVPPQTPPPPVDPNAPVVHHPRGYVAPPPPPTEERIAADLVAAGRWREALPHYQMLAAQNPGDRTYPLVVSILTQRLAIQCVNGLTPTGAPCTGI